MGELPLRAPNSGSSKNVGYGRAIGGGDIAASPSGLTDMADMFILSHNIRLCRRSVALPGVPGLPAGVIPLGLPMLSLSLARFPSPPYVAARKARRCRSASSASACSKEVMSSRRLPDDMKDPRRELGETSTALSAAAAAEGSPTPDPNLKSPPGESSPMLPRCVGRLGFQVLCDVVQPP